MQTEKTPQILFIINPKAGQRKTRQLIRELKQLNTKVDFRISQYPGNSFEIAKENLSNYTYFVVAGGDGTVNEVAPALVGTKGILAVLPVGSGNGFAREFGFTKDVNQLISDIQHGKIIHSDVLRINNRICVHIAGSGFDSAVTRDFENLKRHSFLNYAFSILKVVLNYRPIEATIQLENETISGKFFMINIANTAQFGYNVRIAPEANPADGSFDLVLVSPFSLAYLPIFTLRLLFGRLKSSKKVQYVRCNSNVVISTPNDLFQIEGEPVTIQSPVHVTIEPGNLKVADTGRKRFEKQGIGHSW